jgi:single-strand DNA-binding protein
MNALRNRVQLIGNLGSNPEVKKFDSGKVLVRLNVATSDKHKDETGKYITETQWHHVTVWGNLALMAEKYLQKGHEIAIEGKLVYRNFENKEGKKQFITEIIAQELLMLGKHNQ